MGDFCVIWVVKCVSLGMEFYFQLHKLRQFVTRRLLLVVGVVAITHILFQSLLLPYGNALRSLLPNSNDPIYDQSNISIVQSSAKSVMVRNPLTFDTSSLTNDHSMLNGLLTDANNSDGGGESKDIGHDGGSNRNSGGKENGFSSEEEDPGNAIELVVDRNADNDFPSENVVNRNETFGLDSVKTQESNSILKLASEGRHDLSPKQNVRSNHEISTEKILHKDTSLTLKELRHVNTAFKTRSVESQAAASSTKITYLKSNESSSVGSAVLRSHLVTSKNDSARMGNSGRKKMRCEMPPKSITLIDEMNSILMRHRRSSRAMV